MSAAPPDDEPGLADMTAFARRHGLGGLAPEHIVRALPFAALNALSSEYIATLADDVQAKVRARRGH